MKKTLITILCLLSLHAFAQSQDISLSDLDKPNLPKPYDYFIKGEILNIAKAKFTEEVETGAYLTPNLYVKVKGEHQPGHTWGVDETIGLQHNVSGFTPYGELSYDYDGNSQFTQWRNNTHYVIGFKRDLISSWNIYVQMADFTYNARTVGSGFDYAINDHYTLGLDYSYQINKKHHTVGMSAQYNF